MNNNRNNNRRRGRGNNNRQNGGGQQVNRIDSRARGNAPQLLEKYRKLALDSHMNGDRVNEEYYLQFADHYFRVIADTRVRQEEGRQRRDDRWNDASDTAREDADDTFDYGGDAYGEEPEPAGERRERAPRFEPAPEPVAEAAEDAATAEPQRSVYEPPTNPFVRDGRAGRGPRQRVQRRDPPRAPRDDDEAGREPARESAPRGDEARGFDPAALPASLTDAAPRAARVAAPAAAAAGDDAALAPKRRRGRPPAPRADDSDETLQVVN